MNRDEVEKNLNFLGFLIMQNKLKAATVKSIFELNEADIRTIMATGDNILTAMSVGRKCGIIKEEQIIYLGDLVEDGDKQGITWKIAKDSEAIMQDHIHPRDVIKNMNLSMALPWEKDQEEGFAIAISGKAFNYLIKDSAMKALLQQVLLRGQIFARMTPDDKA
jgi:cation-transporting P-type ATPase 13A2